jgi:hypothetical protein
MIGSEKGTHLDASGSIFCGRPLLLFDAGQNRHPDPQPTEIPLL